MSDLKEHLIVQIMFKSLLVLLVSELVLRIEITNLLDLDPNASEEFFVFRDRTPYRDSQVSVSHREDYSVYHLPLIFCELATY